MSFTDLITVVMGALLLVAIFGGNYVLDKLSGRIKQLENDLVVEYNRGYANGDKDGYRRGRAEILKRF